MTSPLVVGNRVLIRTVTLHYTGEIEMISLQEIVLSSAAWIAETGRFSDALKTGVLGEVEPYPDDCRVSVARGGVIDICDWKHPLPREVK